MKATAIAQSLAATTGVLSRWLARPTLANDLPAAEGRRRTWRYRRLVICLCLFLAAFGVRLLYWQDNDTEIASGKTQMVVLGKSYRREAARMLEDRALLFPKNAPQNGDSQIILHPPGYSILLAAFARSFGESAYAVQWLQVLGDSLATVLVFLIAVELLPAALAAVAGLLVAISPHLAYYSLWLTPESLAVLPILLAVYLILRASRQPRRRLVKIIAAGALVGLSCWLRANGLLLAPFLALIFFWSFEPGRRLRMAAVFMAAAVLVIAPITIRNWLVYKRFVPLSLGSGITLIEGIADYDQENRFAMPMYDSDVLKTDALWHGRPDYETNLWSPDGIDRDQSRFARGLEIIRANPVWFSGVMLRRAGFMLSYNNSRPYRWPLATAVAPLIAADPPASPHSNVADRREPALSWSAAELLQNSTVPSPNTNAGLDVQSATLRVEGDASSYGDQLATSPIAVEPYRDYLLRLTCRVERGQAAAKVTDAGMRIALASLILEQDQTASEAPKAGIETGRIEIPFASGNRQSVRIIFSNNDREDSRPLLKLSRLELIEVAPTAQRWTRAVRPSVRGVQKNLFVTTRMPVLVIAGLLLLALARRGRALALLLAVPLYYIVIQSALHTEYRYILAIHYFVFVLAATTIYCFGLLVRAGGQAAINRLAGRRRVEKQIP